MFSKKVKHIKLKYIANFLFLWIMTFINSLMGFYMYKPKKKKISNYFFLFFLYKNKKKTLKNKIWIIHKCTGHIILQNKKRKQNLYVKI